MIASALSLWLVCILNTAHKFLPFRNAVLQMLTDFEGEPLCSGAHIFQIPPGVDDEWCAVRTLPRSEKALAKKMMVGSDRPDFFLPMYVRKKRYQRRMVTTCPPLFSGYLFLRGGEEARTKALYTGKVAKILDVTEQEQLHADLNTIYDMVTSGTELAPEGQLEPGIVADIIDGPFAGRRGKVIRRGRSLRLVVEVKMFQQSASVEVDPWVLRPVSS